MKSKRIQRKRTKGWRMPPNTVYVGRPSVFSNPFKVTAYRSLVECVQRFRSMMKGEYDNCAQYRIKRLAIMESLHRIKGKDLCCWCPLDQPCHADVLLEIANEG